MAKYRVTMSYTEDIETKDRKSAKKKLMKHISEKRIPKAFHIEELECEEEEDK